MVSTSSTSANHFCVELLLHKTCAELPPKIVKPTNQNEFLFFPISRFQYWCDICKLRCTRLSYRSSGTFNFFVCFKCALFQVQQPKEDTTFVHPGHNSHPLAVIQHPSSFKCYACKVVNDSNILELSYRCTKCQFWMHKSCGDAPPSFQSQFHDKHPLILHFSLPQLYCKFPQHCRICNEQVSVKEWLYCCCSCRFFTHFHCARSSPMLRLCEDETYPNLVHLPPADESSLNRLLDQFVKDMITQCNSCNSMSIVSTGNFIKHWSHEEHDLKLISINELHDRENDDEILLLCDGCVKPIGTDDDGLFYSCVSCKYFLHKVCAELPREIEHHLWPGKTLFAKKHSQPFNFFWCDACFCYGNGIFFSGDEGSINLHIGCVNLPKIIKHEVHPHQLDQVYEHIHDCNSCRHYAIIPFKYGCEKCNFYICGRCIMSARTIKHPWDRHPLDLIYDAGMVTNHEHDYNCEYCSKDINTNKWFYHCSICDLSFHIDECLEKSRHGSYKYVKFGASDIKNDQVHPHGFTLVLYKKARTNCAGKCKWYIMPGAPVLQCAPCNTIFCWNCW